VVCETESRYIDIEIIDEKSMDYCNLKTNVKLNKKSMESLKLKANLITARSHLCPKNWYPINFTIPPMSKKNVEFEIIGVYRNMELISSSKKYEYLFVSDYFDFDKKIYLRSNILSLSIGTTNN
jgi:hypothetical protein